MWKLCKPGLGLLAILFLSSSSTHAQFSNVPRWQFGLGAGMLIYQGDLSPEQFGAYKSPRLSLNLMAARLLSPSWALRGNLVLGGLRASDANYEEPEWRQERNFQFRSSVVELSLTPEWNILGRNYDSRGLAPYLFAGIGFSFLNIRRDYSQFNTAYFGDGSPILTGLAEDESVNPPRGLFSVPVGVGLRYQFSDRWGLQAESTYRFVDTDYLDGFSRAANPEKGDSYHGHSISIVYRLGKKNTLDCPPALR